MNKLVLVAAAILMPMAHAMIGTGNVDAMRQRFETIGLGGNAWQPRLNTVGPKVINAPGKRKQYFVGRCIGQGQENAAYIIRDGYTNKDTRHCLKVGAGKAEWEYERDFLAEIADTNVAQYFPRIIDSFPWRGNDGIQKYVIVMEFLEGFVTLKDFVASYVDEGGVPPGVAQSVLTEIVNVLYLLHSQMVTTTSRRGKTKTKPRCHADYHECNIMVRYDGRRVEVMVIDPHKPSQMKPHNTYNDMLFAAKHAVMLAQVSTKPKDAMKEASINQLPAGVRGYIFEALGESNFEAAYAQKFGEICDKNGFFWDRPRRSPKSQKIKSAPEMLAYLRRNRDIFQ